MTAEEKPAPPATRRRRIWSTAWLRAWSRAWPAVRYAVRRRRGWAGLATGTALGALLAVLVPAVLPWPAAPDGGLEPGTIWILSGVDESPGGQRQALIDQWNALPGRPEARIIPVAGGADAARAEMVATAQAGGDARTGADGAAETDTVDIYNLDVPLMAQFVEFEYLRPLDPATVDRSGFLAGPLATCERDGKLWALPFNTDAALLYYRTDLLGPAEPPASWPAVRSRVEQIFAAGDTGAAQGPWPAAGYAGQFADYEGLSVNAFEAIWAAGGEVVDGDGNVVVASPEAREGLRRLAGWLANRQLILPEATRFTEAETTQAFRDGQVVFMRNWPIEYRALLSAESAGPGTAGTPASAGGEPDGKAIPFDVRPLPGHSVLGGQNLALAASTDQPRAAQELIEFLTEPRSQQILFERGGFAATREIVYHDAAILQKYRYAATLLDAIRQARNRPDTPYYALFSEVFREGVRQALANGGELPDGFADRLADALKGVKRN